MNKVIAFLCLILLASACKTKNDISYMQDIENVAVETSLRNAQTTLQSGDQLVIQVSGPDMDVIRPFNQNYSSSDAVRYKQSAANSTQSTQSSTVSGPTYVVDTEGNIDFPVVGKVAVKGKTIEEVEGVLTQDIQKYVKNPTVNARLANFRVTVLGEVKSPGQFIIPDAQATLLNALGMAGDATIYGDRTNVLIVRQGDGALEKQHIDLTKAEFLNSPYFNLKQNDVIYVAPNKTRQQASIFGPQTSVFISITSILVTIAALVFRK